MQISTKTRYGMRAIADLAEGYPDRAISLREIAKRQRISHKYLEQVAAVLKSAGVVRSVRGPPGGYLLARRPGAIPLREIFELLEGPVELVPCTPGGERCDLEAQCPTQWLWSELSQAMATILGDRTVQDLLDRARELKGRGGLDYVI